MVRQSLREEDGGDKEAVADNVATICTLDVHIHCDVEAPSKMSTLEQLNTELCSGFVVIPSSVGESKETNSCRPSFENAADTS